MTARQIHLAVQLCFLFHNNGALSFVRVFLWFTTSVLVEKRRGPPVAITARVQSYARTPKSQPLRKNERVGPARLSTRRIGNARGADGLCLKGLSCSTLTPRN